MVQDPFMYGYKSVEALAAKARGDDSKLVKEPIPYRVVTKDGGPDETVNGLVVKNLKVADFEAKLRADLASGEEVSGRPKRIHHRGTETQSKTKRA